MSSRPSESLPNITKVVCMGGECTAGEDEAALRAVLDGLDAAMAWLEADIRRLQAALDAGISLDVIGALNRIAMESRHA